MAEQLALGWVFSATVLRCLLQILPRVRREVAHWAERAAEIPSPTLRAHAATALAKRGNIEGAALFAVLAPARKRRDVICALVAYQMAYNLLDTLSERPSEDPVANARQLHAGLVTALTPGVVHADYYAYDLDADDGGYLTALIDACRGSLAGLPSYPALAPTALRAAQRTVAFQALNRSEADGGHAALRVWAERRAPEQAGVAWWETAAAAGSSLAVHALIATAANPHLEQRDAEQIDRAYHPCGGALHSLLDSLVDRDEDQALDQRSLLNYYRSDEDAAIRLRSLATCARRSFSHLHDSHAHRVILTAMCSYYLSAPECDARETRLVSRSLTETLGFPLGVAIAMFHVKRRLHALAHDIYA